MNKFDKETIRAMEHEVDAAAAMEAISAAKAAEACEIIGEDLAGTYKTIEDGVVDTYKKIEDTVVGAYQKIEDGFVGKFLTREGETVEEAKNRLKK